MPACVNQSTLSDMNISQPAGPLQSNVMKHNWGAGGGVLARSDHNWLPW